LDFFNKKKFCTLILVGIGIALQINNYYLSDYSDHAKFIFFFNNIIFYRGAFILVTISQIVLLIVTITVANYDCIISNWATYFVISSLNLYEIFKFEVNTSMKSCHSWSSSFEFYFESNIWSNYKWDNKELLDILNISSENPLKKFQACYESLVLINIISTFGKTLNEWGFFWRNTQNESSHFNLMLVFFVLIETNNLF